MASAATPLGEPIDYVRPPRPEPVELHGRYVVLRPLDPTADAVELFACSHPPDGDTAIWAYLFEGPFASADEMLLALQASLRSDDYVVFTVVAGGKPRGSCSYLRITPEHGVIEIGSIWFAASLQRSTATTEAIYLLARHAFDALGYRRLEWKCNALNAPSRRAAERFGFVFEGVFKQHMVIWSHPPRNRDTAWFAITSDRWPAVREAFETWLAPSNFDSDGEQRVRLGELMP